MPPSSRKSRRCAEPGAVRQSNTAEAGWKQRMDVFRQKLQTQLKVIWMANSEQTRVDAVEDIRRSFYSLFGNGQEGVPEQALCAEIGHVVFSTMSIVILPEAALQVRANLPDKESYVETMQMMAQLVVRLYAGTDATRISRTSMFHVLRNFSDNMNASSPGARYRIVQFVNLILKGFLEAEIVFSHVGSNGENFLKKALFDRTYDINSKVAAMAVETIGHFQFEDDVAQRTRAFSVLWFRMQDHESHLVRAAATRTIQVTPQSAPAIVRRAFDRHPDVRVAGFEVISDMIAAKIVKVQLRSHLLMTGLNDQNALVRAAAATCLQVWLRDCNNDYAGLVNDVGVEPGKPLFANKQIGMEIFDVAQDVKEICGNGSGVSSTDTRMRSPNENNLPAQ
ncbi:hypothetical protein RvY_09427 [Ramazzottius varieornatus]|uniref:TOG domain-containing protein n=1 Tax=Ramazzottius varieornatus TaxID=947166 RepID=A0A1D1VBR2_RAMVA|nr:hypothetical protein RvY_09427 [Ramazzottius varieornatus]